MKKRILLVTVLSLAFGLSVATFGYQQISTTPTAVSCCDKDDCCKGDSCPMKKNAGGTAAAGKDCCHPDSKEKVSKPAV
jgi:hypothetical protein